MALSNLVVEKLEKFGGIDLKRNYQKYFSNALAISIGLHLLLIFFYVGYNWFTEEQDRHIPMLHIKSIADLAPPPSTQDQPQEALPPPPPPSADVVKPNLGVPVPVPDAVAPQVTLPDMNQPTPQVTVPGGTGTGPADLVPQANSGPVNLGIQTPAKVDEPTEDEFIDVSKEPVPITPIEKLIDYPEVARRSGLEGKVQVAALINTDGTVKRVKVEKSDYDVFKQAAIDAMMKAKFTPALQGTTPVSLWIPYTITFKLK